MLTEWITMDKKVKMKNEMNEMTHTNSSIVLHVMRIILKGVYRIVKPLECGVFAQKIGFLKAELQT